MTRKCRICGREFDSAKGISTHFRHQHDNKPWLPKADLRRLYHEEGLTQREIADKFDVTQRPVQLAMEKYEIESDKARNDPTHPPTHYFDKKSDVVGTEYEVVSVTQEYESQSVAIHRLLAIAYGLLEPEEYFVHDVVVHHKTGHGLDNRPENLEVMERGEHQSHHLRERYG